MEFVRWKRSSMRSLNVWWSVRELKAALFERVLFCVGVEVPNVRAMNGLSCVAIEVIVIM